LLHAGDLPGQRDVLEDAFDLLGAEVVLAHAKELDSAGHAGGLALGTGALDWNLFLALLRRVAYTGPVIMHGFDESSVATSVAFLRQKGVRL
jgi:sugar phosphate isomerase/epimerase